MAKKKLLNLRLTELQTDVYETYVSLKFRQLGVRAQNAIASVLGEDFSADNIIFRINSLQEMKLTEIRNIGSGTVGSLKTFIKDTENYLDWVIRQSEERILRAHRNKNLLCLSFPDHNFPIKLFHAHSIFPIVDYLIKKDILFDGFKKEIYLRSFKIFNNSKVNNFKHTAKKLNISPERVRQVKKYFEEQLDEKLEVLAQIAEDFEQEYELQFDGISIDINPSLCEKINQKHATNFSLNFIKKLISICLRGSYALEGEFYDIFRLRNSLHRSKHNWKNLYLIHARFAKVVNFIDLLNDLSVLSSKRNIKDKKIDFKEYVASFVYPVELVHSVPLKELIIDLVSKELDSIEFTQSELVIKRNTIMLQHEYCYKALKALGKPSHIDEIRDKLNKMFPDVKDFNIIQVRSSLKRVHGFIPIGRSSYFALKEWEGKLDNFKGGTIREIVGEYLNKYDEPKLLSDITAYVQKYRPGTNSSSISTNLRLKSPSPYIFFKGGLVGLKSKYYGNNLKTSIPLSGVQREDWDTMLDKLVVHLQEKQRFPYPTHVSSAEKKLYNWYILQRKNLETGKLSEDRVATLLPVLDKYSKSDRRRYRRTR